MFPFKHQIHWIRQYYKADGSGGDRVREWDVSCSVGQRRGQRRDTVGYWSGPWHLYANCCREQVCWAFLSRARQIWVVPRRCSWDVQWIQSAQINGALFSHFFLATEPADNSGGRAGGPWAAVDKACGGRHSGSGGLPSYTPRPRLQTNLASVSFLFFLSLFTVEDCSC